MTIRFSRLGTKRNSEGNGLSRFEAEIRAEIEMNGIIGTHKTSKIPYSENHNYIPDFVLPNGIVIEAKGYFPPEDRVKMRAVKESNPDLDIRIVFLRAKSKLDKNAKMTYGEWADKYGFPYADRHIPLEWLYEKKEVNSTAQD